MLLNHRDEVRCITTTFSVIPSWLCSFKGSVVIGIIVHCGAEIR